MKTKAAVPDGRSDRGAASAKPRSEFLLYNKLGRVAVACVAVVVAASVFGETWYAAGTDNSGASALNGTGTYGWRTQTGTAVKNHKPCAGNDYVVPAGVAVRSQASGDYTFLGDSLLMQGGTIGLKCSNKTLTIPNLIFDSGSIALYDSGPMYVGGNVTIRPGCKLNLSGSQTGRRVHLKSHVIGDGSTVISSTGASDASPQSGESSSSGAYFYDSLSDFYGKMSLNGGDNIFCGYPGPSQRYFAEEGFLQKAGALTFLTSCTSDVFRAVKIDGYCRLHVPAGVTVQIDGKFTANGFRKSGDGTLVISQPSDTWTGTTIIYGGTLKICGAMTKGKPTDRTITAGSFSAFPNLAFDHQTGTLVCDETVPFAEKGLLLVEGEPSNIGEPELAYGQHDGYAAGQTVTLSAPTNIQENADARWCCLGGEALADGVKIADLEGAAPSFTYPDAYAVAVNWKWRHEYRIAVAADEGGTASAANGGWGAEGDTLMLTAKAAAGFRFSRWVDANGKTVSREATYACAVTASAAYRAVFAGIPKPRYQSKMTVSGYTGTTELEDFPVLVRISTERIQGFSYADCAADGADISFAAGDAADRKVAVYPHEIETWNPEGESLVWVRVPRIAGQETTFYFRWNDASAKDLEPTATWAGQADYRGVWHMADEGLEQGDSSGWGLAATSSGDVWRELGKIGQAMKKSKNLSAPNFQTQAGVCPTSYSVSAWFYWPNFSTQTYNTHPLLYGNYSNKEGWYVEYSKGSSSMASVSVCCNGSAETFNTGVDPKTAWTHLALTYDGATLRVYYNGVQKYTKTVAINHGDYKLTISDNAITHYVDETRVRNAVSSGDWVKAEYEQGANADWLSAGAREKVSYPGLVVLLY